MSSSAEPLSPPALEARGLTVQYGASTTAVKDVSIHVSAGETVAILGSNGAGKTSLLRAFSGILGTYGGRILSGTVCRGGVRLGTRAPDKRVRMGIVQVPEGRQVFGALTVEENLRVGGYGQGRSRSETRERLERAFDMFPILGERRHQHAGLLSGGEQQMLAIARAMMAHPSILLLDEPSLGLAPRIVDQMSEILQDIRIAGTSMLIVEQNAHVALELADRAYVLAVGEVALEGRAQDLKTDPKVQAAYLGGEIEVMN